MKNRPSRNRPPASRRVAPGRGVDMKKVIVAARKAVRAAVRRHKLLGQSICVWEDGKVVIVPASRIKV